MILLANPWAFDVHGMPVTSLGSDAIVANYDNEARAETRVKAKADPRADPRAKADGAGTLQAAPVEPAARLAAMTDPEPALIGILSLGFAGLLSIRRRRG